MNHLCFIIDNSLTMDQRPYNGISLLDCVKSSIQNTLRNLYRLGFPNNHEHIHLFCTSNPLSYLSSYEHDQSHLYSQLKSITSSINTNPALTIQTAISQISKFRILSQAETFKGYRQSFIFEPALIIFLSDRMTRKKIMSIVNAIDEGKLCMRSQYQFEAYLLGVLSYTERNLITQQMFKSTLENQKQINLYSEALRKISTELKFITSYENINTSLWNRIETYKPFLLFHFQLKQIKRKMPQFVPSERGTAYFKAWQQHLSNIPFQLVPSKLFKIPLPLNIKLSETDGQMKIQKIGKLRFYLDLTKKYTEVNSNILPENRYKILTNPAIKMLEGENLQERYPIFIQHKGIQCPIGLLNISSRGSEVSIYFANFTMLNSVLRMIEAKNNFKNIQSSLTTYLNSIPHFYLKFLKIIFDKLNLNFDYDSFENPLLNTNALNIQNKLENLRLSEKRNLPKIFQLNLQNHQNYRAQCCSTYSQNYNLHQNSYKNQKYNDIELYFSDLVGDLLSFKKKIGIEDYLSNNQMDSVPMIKQLQKYNNVKKMGDDDFNQNITINLGNPYRKKRKVNEGQSNLKEIIMTKQAAYTRSSQVANMDKDINKTRSNTPNILEQKRQRQRQNDKTKSDAIIPQNVEKQSLQRQDEQMGDDLEETLQNNSFEQEKSSQPPNETLTRLNHLPLKKSIQMAFNPVNLATEAMLKNEAILNAFLLKLKKK